MERIYQLTIKYVEQMPQPKKQGVLYISKRFGLAIHLCACGCGEETVTPIANDKEKWNLTEINGLVTLRPSIGNFKGDKPYHAHYYITNNKIDWL